MEETTRRTFLKSSSIAAGLLAGSAVVSAKNNNKNKLRIRRDYKDTLSVKEITHHRNDFIESADGVHPSDIPTAKPVGKTADKQVAAYNLDLIDGAVHEWTGVVRGKRNNDSEFTTHKNSGNKKAPKEIVENVHKKADEDVRVKRKKKSRLNNNQVDVAKKSDEVDFDVGWDDMASNDHWEEGEWGTTMGWNVQWKKAPNAESVHGVKAHVNLKPGKEHPIIKDRAEKAILKQNYNHADVFSEDYRPYNTNGQASESWSIGVTAGSDTVNVGVEHSTQHSKKDMEIHDDSAVNDPDLQNMEHTYDISNDLRKHTVRATQFGIVEVDDKDKDGEKFAYIDLQGEFKQCDIQNGYDYYW